VNFYQLDKEFEIVADPVFSGDTLVLATNKGLVVARTTRAVAKPTTAGQETKAEKKSPPR
jgi:hypothetical protein